MRKTLFLLFLLSVGHSAQAGTPRKTVLDYFRSVPIRFLSTNGMPFDRERALTVRDTANGYLSYEVSDAPLEGQVALFRTANDGALLALVIDDCGGCGEGYHQTLHFLEERAGRWIDRTTDVLPRITEPMLVDQVKKVTGRTITVDQTSHAYPDFRLPRHGTTITVQLQSSDTTPLFHLVWNRTRFELRTP